MEVRISLLGGVAPAAILATAMLIPAILARRSTVAPGPSPAPPEGPSRVEGLAWPLGAALGILLIHYATWSWPVLWHRSAPNRFASSAGLLLAWALIEVLLPRPRAVASPAGIALVAARWIGRAAAIGVVAATLLTAYGAALGRPMVIGGTVSIVVLVLGVAWAAGRGLSRHHPAWVWGSLGAAALAASGVLMASHTATAAGAAAGVGALSLATAAACLLRRRCSPGSIAAFVLSGSLAWLLAVGAFASGETNLGAAALLLLAPAGWAVRGPVTRAKTTRRWLTSAIGVAWTIACIAGAVGLELATRTPKPENPYLVD